MDRVCHFEVPYSDKARAEKFYADVFGWQMFDSPGDAVYTFAITTPVDEQHQPQTPGGINGGMYPRGEGGASQSPLIVIEVDSCEQRIADVAAAGGTALIGPVEIPNMGVYAQVRDSEDNTIGLWQPLPPTG